MSNYPENHGIAWQSKALETQDPVVFQVCGMCCRGHPEPLHTMECFLGNSQISRTAHQALEGKVLSKNLHSAPTGDSWGRRLGFAAWSRPISVAIVFSWWLTGETMAHGMCCTCAAPFLWPEPSISCWHIICAVAMREQEPSGWTIIGSSVLGTGSLSQYTLNPHPSAVPGASCTSPFTCHSNHKPLENPFLGNLKDCSPCLCPEHVTTWS